jgi:primosomal protein N' (replication factor Y)
VAVLLPLPLGGFLDYRVPGDVSLEPGDIVRVPLGRRSEIGVVWGPGSQALPPERLRPVVARLPAPPLPAVTRKLVEWVAAYTLSSPGAVLRMALSVPSALEPPRPSLVYRLGRPLDDAGLRATPARLRVLEMAQAGPLSATELANAAEVTVGVVRSLADAGVLEAVRVGPAAPPQPDPRLAGPLLSPAQAEAAAALAAKVTDGFSVTLLEGVTGSGKTEVYFEAIAAALRAGRQVLVLLPEIALGTQWLERFTRRFGAAPTPWHSELPDGQRRQAWREVAAGRASVVVGARSALFLPYADLGLIIVDEEHDASFKQEEGVIYHARDMAVVRGRIGGHAVILASATPSLETATNAATGKYARLHLPDRHAGAALPGMAAIDLRKTPPPRGRWLAPPLAEAVTATLAAGEQAMLFLNRRGYAPLTLCRACGHRLQCPNCTAWLVEHRRVARLQCHHCGHLVTRPETCPNCDAADSFVACGPGVERLAEEVAECFPQARLEVMASDLLSSQRAAAEIVQRMAAAEVDILIGTQIVAKGHHFPLLTLVGVVDADLGLSGGDLRAAERTWQLLWQVAGRAGRAEHPGRVLLQTYQPDHPVMKALIAGDGERFLAEEAEERRMVGMPPFGKLAALIVSGPDEARVDAVARALGRAAPHEPGITVFGPAPAPLSLLRGRHRRRLLLKAERSVNVQQVLRAWLGRVDVPDAVRVQVDVDPYGFF